MAALVPPPWVLIIDDDLDFAKAMEKILTEEGYRVRLAADGDQGVHAAAEQPPDLILLDYMMPIKSGFDACQELRAIPALRRVPILVLTAFGQNIGVIHGAEENGRGFDIQDCIEKPVEVNVLLSRMAAALARRQSSGPATAQTPATSRR